MILDTKKSGGFLPVLAGILVSLVWLAGVCRSQAIIGCPQLKDSYTKGDWANVCMVVTNSTTNGTLWSVFKVKVDDFSVIQIHNSKAILPFNDTTQQPSVYLEFQNKTTVGGKRYRVSTNVVPFWTVQVKIVNGVADSVIWDQGCFSCSGTACVDGACTVSSCGVGIACNAKMYVSWVGTDSNGLPMLSSGFDQSKYTSYVASGDANFGQYSTLGS
eukprot:gnl/Hemi2/8854_TR3061_c0_g1_i1.p1 gnl/Hemi2/8854_TR3061_c0_g1~~gnl/Hemi2/8854_TR3061_c0_g1_i1.p1  ORF type:complete len:216 (+),score=30.41 gnl/Hemi2/8854_TR3061_c0_g1_i1:144-791(+)